MNKVILVGNVTKDLELKTTTNGIATCTFSIAVNRKFKNAQGVQEADYINIVTWRQTAELCAKYLAKGRKVGIVGSIQNRSYTAKDGGKRYVTEVVADDVEFLTPRGSTGENVQAGQPTDISNGFTEVTDDDSLPF